MSAILCDSFDTYFSYAEKWTVVGASADASHIRIDTATSRNGGQSLGITGGANTAAGRIFPSGADATCFIHVAMRRSLAAGVASGGTVLGITVRSNNLATPQASLVFLNNGDMLGRRGDFNGAFPIGSTLVGVTPLDTWFHIGWRINIHDTTGSMTVWYNGTQIYTISGQDTMSSSSFPTIDSISLYGNGGTPAGTAYQLFDDLVVLNAAGSINNNYLGDVAVVTLRPNGVGDRTQLTPVGGATNWDNVNEPIHTGLDYNASDTVGQGDLYALENLPASVGVSFVQQSSYARKNTTAAKSLAHIMKIGGTEYAQTAIPLDTSFAALSNVIEQNPAGGAWSSTALNAAQIGVEVRA
jgi:hypothetical protein